MRKKSVVILFLIFAILCFNIFNVLAQTEEEKVNKAYNWLINEVTGEKAPRPWDKLTIREHAFVLSALSYDYSYRKKGINALYAKSYNNTCWGNPESSSKLRTQAGCTILGTALAKIALDYAKENTEAIENWLIEQENSITTQLYWFLQLDAQSPMNCTIDYTIDIGGSPTSYTTRVYMSDDKKIKIIGGNNYCFTESKQDVGPYWLQIRNVKECLDNTYYIISCNVEDYSEFSASIFYKKSLRERDYFLYSSTALTESGSKAQLIPISALCFPRQFGFSDCDYESTAWAVAVLKSQLYSGHSYSQAELNKFLPYLIAYAKDRKFPRKDNSKYLPNAFLYPISEYQYFGKALVEEQQLHVLGQYEGGISGGFWYARGIGGVTPYGKYYDTALAGLGLGANGVMPGYSATDAITKAKIYLLRPDVQAQQGFWARGSTQDKLLRDTAFILWVYWPREFQMPSECEEANYSCYNENRTECPEGMKKVDLYCKKGICCREMVDCEKAGGVCQEIPCDPDLQRNLSDYDKSCSEAGLGDYCCFDLTNCEISGGKCFPGTSEKNCPSEMPIDNYSELNKECTNKYSNETEPNWVCCFEKALENECVANGGFCRSSSECFEGEEQWPYQCPGTEICCHTMTIPPSGPETTQCQVQFNYTCMESGDCEKGFVLAEYDYGCEDIGMYCCKPCESIEDCYSENCAGYAVKDYEGHYGLCNYPMELNCTDSFDNDYDGYTDCEDDDCSNEPVCIGITNLCEKYGGHCCIAPASGAEHYSDYDEECGFNEKCYSECGTCLSEGHVCCEECSGSSYADLTPTCGEGKQCCDSCYIIEKKECYYDSDCQEGYECIDNKCVKKEKSNIWLWILIAVLAIVVIGLAYYLIVFKKKPKKPKPSLFKPETRPPALGRPILRVPPRPPGQGTLKQPPRPILRPLGLGIRKIPPSQIKKIEKPKEVKKKKKTESELEKTFKKLKKITKK